MKRLYYYIILMSSIVCYSCTDDDNDETWSGVSDIIELSQYQILKGFFTENLRCDTLLVFNSKDDMLHSYSGNLSELPMVDWNRQTVFVGQVYVPDGSYIIKDIEMNEAQDKSVLTIVVSHVEKVDAAWIDAFNSLYFWKVFPKCMSKVYSLDIEYIN